MFGSVYDMVYNAIRRNSISLIRLLDSAFIVRSDTRRGTIIFALVNARVKVWQPLDKSQSVAGGQHCQVVTEQWAVRDWWPLHCHL